MISALPANHLAFIAAHRGTVHRTDRAVTVTGYIGDLSFWAPLVPDEPVPDDATFVRLYPGCGASGRLTEAGFVRAGTLRYLTAPAHAPIAAGADITRVRTGAEAAAFAAVQEAGFREADDSAALQAWWLGTFTDAARRNRTAPDQAFFLARRDGVPAAVALGLHAAGLCGVYAVATRPEFRGRGLATALLERVRRYAVERGAGRLTLQVDAGSAAERLYRRLGFGVAFDAPGYARPARRSASAMAPSD